MIVSFREPPDQSTCRGCGSVAGPPTSQHSLSHLTRSQAAFPLGSGSGRKPPDSLAPHVGVLLHRPAVTKRTDRRRGSLTGVGEKRSLGEADHSGCKPAGWKTVFAVRATERAIPSVLWRDRSPTSYAPWPCPMRWHSDPSRRCRASWSRPAPRWSATAATPRSSWPRWPCRDSCSGPSCRSSPACGHHS